MRGSRKNSVVWIALLVILALVPGMPGWPAVLAEGDVEIEFAGDERSSADIEIEEEPDASSPDDTSDAAGLGGVWLEGVELSETEVVTEEPAYAAPAETVDTSKLNGSNWMSAIDDRRPIYEINLPGTHDSATANPLSVGTLAQHYQNYAKCQNLKIKEQLKAGIRFFDLRLCHEIDILNGIVIDVTYDDYKNLWLIHGDWQAGGAFNMRYFCYNGTGMSISLYDVLGDIEEFLRSHPTETVIINVCRESGDSKKTVEEINAIVDQRLKEHFQKESRKTNPATGKSYLYGSGNFSSLPTLGECRGQIVVLSEHPGEVGYGTIYSGSRGSSSVDRENGRPVMTIGDTRFYFENHYDVKKDEKELWVRRIFSGLGGESLPNDPTMRIGHGMLVQSSSNVVIKQDPKEISDHINPILYGEDGLFSQRGLFYGWVLSDYVTEETAKKLWITNFPECVHDMEVSEAVAATCTEDGAKRHFTCRICKKVYLDRDGRKEAAPEDVKLPATGHTPGKYVEENVVAPKDGKDGSYDEVVYCAVCDQEVSRKAVTVEFDAVQYVDEHGMTRCREAYTSFDTLTEETGWGMSDGWYAVKESATYDTNRLTVVGDVNLILCDGATLTLVQGIRMDSKLSSKLTIWCQKGGTGKLVCGPAEEDKAGIGGNSKESGGTLILRSGEVEARGGKNAAGVGGGYKAYGGQVSVYGGKLTAVGGAKGAGIGGGYDRTGGTLEVFDGTVIAEGGADGAGVGGGYAGNGGIVIVRGGVVNAKGGVNGAGIGGGKYDDGGGSGATVTIYGGNVTAIGGDNGAGIGGGCRGNGEKVYIHGGKVYARGGNRGAGIGTGYGRARTNPRGWVPTSYTRDVTITGGDVTAIGGLYGGGVGMGGLPTTVGYAGDNGVTMYNELVIFGGTLQMTGGTLLAGGGDSKVYLTKGGKGPAALGLKLNRLELGDHLCVKLGDSRDALDYRPFCLQRDLEAPKYHYARIEACDHVNQSYQISESGHTPICENCISHYGDEEPHTFDEQYRCVVCGYAQPTCTITFRAGGGSGTMAPVLAPLKNGTYSLPNCAFDAPVDKLFERWSVPGQGTFMPGSEIALNATDIVVIAEWADAFNLWVGSVRVNYVNRKDILGDGTLAYDPEAHVLTVKNPDPIAGHHDGWMIYAEGMDALTVKGSGVIEPENGRERNGIHMLFGRLILEATGTGTDALTVKAGQTALRAKHIDIEKGRVNALGGDYGAYSYSHDQSETIVIRRGASLEAKGSDPLYSPNPIRIDGHCVKLIRPDGSVRAGRVSEGYIISVDRQQFDHVLIEPHKMENLVHVPAVPVTCTADGASEHYKCNDCGLRLAYREVYEDFLEMEESDAVIPATGHDFGEWVQTKAPTDTEEGEEKRTCVYCDAFETRPIPVDDVFNLVKVDAKAATCTEPGNREYWKRTSPDGSRVYGHYRELTDEEAGGVDDSDIMTYTDEVTGKIYDLLKIDIEDTVIPAIGHDWGEPEYEWAEDHTSVTATRFCEKNKTHVETETTADVAVNRVAPTCTLEGRTVYVAVFTNPAFSVSETVTESATGHTNGAPVNENEKGATCEEAGSYDAVVYCTVCQEELRRETKVTEPAKGHASGETVVENRKAPTCEESGSHDEVVYCGVCQKELSRQTKVIEALGHDWGDWFVVSSPTGEEKYVQARFCSRDWSHVDYGDEVEMQDYYCSDSDENLWLTGSEEDLEFEFTRTMPDEEAIWQQLRSLKLDDGENVTEIQDYNSEYDEGDTETMSIVLEADLLKTLKPGTCRLVAIFNDGGTDVDGNYDVEDDYDVEVGFTVADVVALDDLEYDGTEQDLVYSENSSITFALGENAETVPISDYSPEIPTGTDAGTYHVWYRAAEEGEPVCLSVTIEPAELTELNLSAADRIPDAAEGLLTLAYNGEERSVQTEVKAGERVLPEKDYTLTVAVTPQKDAGLYLVQAEAVEGGNCSGSLLSAFYIQPKDVNELEVILPTDSVFYTGEENKPELTVKDGEKVLKPGDDYTVAYSDNVNVGTGVAKITGKGNYWGIRECSFTIAKAVVKVSRPPVADAITYGQTLADSVLTGGDWQPKVEGHFEWKEKTTAPAVADSGRTQYGVTFVPDDDANYAAEADASCATVVVIPANPTVNPPSAISPLSYTGAAQDLVTKGSAGNGTMMYAVGKTAPTDKDAWKETVPTGTETGDYIVWYKVFGDTNYKDTEAAPLYVTIYPAQSGEVAPDSLVYNGKAQKLVVAGTVKGGALQYFLGDAAPAEESQWSYDIPTGTDAGEYKVWYRVKGDENHNDSEAAPVMAKIAKAPITPGVAITGWTYGEVANAPTLKGNPGEGKVTFLYSDERDGAYTETVPTQAGSWFVKAEVAETRNYLGATAAPVSFAIARVNIFIFAENKSGVYRDALQALTYRLGGKTVNGEDLGIRLTTTAKADSAPGDYPIAVKWNENANYSAIVMDGVYAVGKRPVTVAASDQTVRAGEKIAAGVDRVTATGLAGGHRLSAVKLAASGSAIVASKAKIVDAEGVDVTANYAITYAAGKLDVRQPEKPVVVPPVARKLTYNGKARALVIAGKAEGGTLLYSTDNKTWSKKRPTATDAGSYTVFYRVKGDADHSDVDTSSLKVTIAKAAPKVTAPKAKKLTYNGKAQALVTAGKVGGGKLLYSADNKTWSKKPPTGTKAGSYTVYYKVKGDKNHIDAAAKRVKVTIAERTAAPDYTLLAKMTASGSDKLKLSWTKVKGAQGYDVFFKNCDGKQDYTCVTVTGKRSYTITGLKKRNSYKAYVVAWKKNGGRKYYIGNNSPVVHAITGSYTSRKCNAKSVKLNMSSLTLKAGKSKTLKATVKGVKSGRDVLRHVRLVRYYSSDANIAKVSKNGKITAVGRGSCTIYAVANNGVRTSVKVNVK